jgi:hypothetical protein
MANTPAGHSSQVSVKDRYTRERFVVDLEKAQRFEFTWMGDRREVLYRFEGDLWVEESMSFRGSRRYYVAELIDIVYNLIELIECGSNSYTEPQGLMPTHVYDVSWTCMWDHQGDEEFLEEMESFSNRRASLYRLRNGMWAVVDLAVRAGARPHQILSAEEALDLLLREGYPTPEHPLPDDLLELSERRRFRASQPTDGPPPEASHTTQANATRLTLTEQTVLEIIRSLPKGEGITAKLIIKKLKAKRIEIVESTLRKHILRKLKEHYGVVNQPGAGGYLIP